MNLIKRYKTAAGVLVPAGLAIAAVLFVLDRRGPSAISIDPKLYDDYAGYYIFANGFPVTITHDGARLLYGIAEYMPEELFAETQTRFFRKGSPAHWIFHRDERGAIDYAISRWNNHEERAMKTNAIPATPVFTNFIIAATTAGPALKAGLAVLRDGGSAADAAIATALCEIVHAAGSYVSFAGPMMLVYYDAEQQKVVYLDAEYAIPLNETNARSIPRTGGRTALVPGFMAGIEAAHRRFGKLPWSRLFQPAIALAEDGEPVHPALANWIQLKKSVLSRYPETKRLFTRSDGTFLLEGDPFRQAKLAATLRQVAALGAAHMYTGAWGKQFVEAVQRQGGRITEDDMRRYQALWEEPLQTTYRDYTICTTGPTPWGGENIIEGLNLLELANIKSTGHYTNSAESLFRLMQIAARVTASHTLSASTRISKAHAADVWRELQARVAGSRQTAAAERSGHTDGLVVVDRWGNMAVMNHTINTALWGETGLFVGGVSIPDSARFQGATIAQVGPGNRLPNGMSPLIICREGKPVLGSAATGGGLHAKTLQMLVNILDFNMDPQSAVDTPAFLGWSPGEVEEGTFSPALLEGLRVYGVKAKVNSMKKAVISRGYWVGVQIDGGTLRGGVSRGLESGIGGE